MANLQSLKVLDASSEVKVTIGDVESTFSVPAGKDDGILRREIENLNPVATQALGLECKAYGLSMHKNGKVKIYVKYETPEDGEVHFTSPLLSPEKYPFELADLAEAVTKIIQEVGRLATQQKGLFDGSAE